MRFSGHSGLHCSFRKKETLLGVSQSACSVPCHSGLLVGGHVVHSSESQDFTWIAEAELLAYSLSLSGYEREVCGLGEILETTLRLQRKSALG